MSELVETSERRGGESKESEAGALPPTPDATPGVRAWRRFKRNRPAVISLGFLICLTLFIAIWPLVSPYSPNAVSDAQYEPPGARHWCGTDVNGRDLLTRMAYGARISLLVGAVGAGVSLLIGVTWGAIAGYLGGRWDGIMMRFVDILYSLPSIVFVIVLISSLDGLLKKWSSPLVSVNDLKSPATLVVTLRDPKDPLSRDLQKLFSESFRKELANFTGKAPPEDALQRALVEELNGILNGPALHTKLPFQETMLRQKTKRLSQQPVQGAEIVRLNRLLLEDAYPDHIARRENWFTRTVTAIFSPKFGASTQMLFLFIGLGAVSWLTMARIVRGQVMSLRTRSFVDASRALGASHARILWHHILPNVMGIIIVYVTLTVPAIILYESFLSYLGLGIQPPMASWGSLISDGASQLNAIRIYWWLIVCPGAMLVSTLLALNFLGDGLRDAYDPRGRT